MATVTLWVAVATVFPDASCTATTTDGLMLAPAVTFVGWTAKASLLAVGWLFEGPGGALVSLPPQVVTTATNPTATDTEMHWRTERAAFTVPS
jgi:hypothetical protein